jgi:hypothetical protein
MRRTWVLALVVVCSLAACRSDATPSSDKPIETPKKLAGVPPKQFDCGSIASVEALGQLLGGTAKPVDGAISTQEGLAKPCSYDVAVNGVERWFFDFDCRPNYRQTAEQLFKDYNKDSSDLATRYDQLKDAGAVKPNDAGTSLARPTVASEVQVGQRALDHHGQGLLFIDDDAPCYVRVVGPDAARRLELAKLIAKNLTFANAPMTPRAFQ